MNMNRISKMMAVVVVFVVSLVGAGTAVADILVENQQVSFLGVTNQNQPLAKVIVGATDVIIESFGVYGQAQVNGNLKWVIFDSTSLSAPVFLSAAQAVTGNPGTFADNAQWYDSPSMDFTLLAGHTYAMGVIADQVSTNTFRWGSSFDNPFGPYPTVTGGGLSLPFEQSLCNSGLVSGAFTNTPYVYFIDNSNRRQMSLRVFDPVPEPATLALLGLGGLGVTWIRKRKK